MCTYVYIYIYIFFGLFTMGIFPLVFFKDGPRCAPKNLPKFMHILVVLQSFAIPPQEAKSILVSSKLKTWALDRSSGSMALYSVYMTAGTTATHNFV